MNGRLDKLFGILMEAHRVQKFGKATKVAQPLEFIPAVPTESTDQAWACTEWLLSSLCSNTAEHWPFNHFLADSSHIHLHLQTLRRKVFPEQATAPSLHSRTCSIFSGKLLVTPPHPIIYHQNLRLNPLR